MQARQTVKWVDPGKVQALEIRRGDLHADQTPLCVLVSARGFR